jgi:hypothetical protein
MPAVSGPGVPENPRFREIISSPGERRVGRDERNSQAYEPVRRKWLWLLLAPMLALGLASIISQVLTKLPHLSSAQVRRLSEPLATVPVKEMVRLMDFRLFESGLTPPPYGERRYQTIFDQRTTRFINWEVTLVFDPAQPKRDLPFKAVLYGPGNQALGQQHGRIRPVDVCVWHSWGWGSRESGHWSPGEYRVEIEIGPSLIASRKFQVR